MAKVILRIGYDTYLLPNDVGLMAVVKAISKALPCSGTHYPERKIEVREIAPTTVEISYIAAGDKIHWPKAKEPETEPEQLCLGEPKSIIPPKL